ncbi:MAG: FAD-dependent oxidoreductase [Phycisphaerae bacterium]
MRRLTGQWMIAAAVLVGWTATAGAENYNADIVVYGGTSGGVTAAVQAARMGKSVILIDPGDYVGTNPDGSPRYVSHLGGLSSGGLGSTDAGDGSEIGGLAFDFYRREDRIGGGSGWNVISSKAEAVFDAMVAESGVTLHRLGQLDRTPAGLTMNGTKIQSFRTKAGRSYSAKVFIDATYEGDLMAAAGVNYTVGREARSQYGESYNGIAYDISRHHIFSDNGANVDPYVTPGDPNSGLIDGVHLTGQDPAGNGAADNRIQAYCYRMTWTDGSNRVKWTDLWGANGENAPEGYDRDTYEVHDRYIRETGNKLSKVVRLDTGIGSNLNDINNWGPASTDYLAGNYDVYVPATGNITNYAEASDEEREYIIQKHIEYTKGFLYYLAFDSPVTSQMAKWGLAPGEFTDNEHFPHQLYVREARRMLGEFVMTELNTRSDNPVDVPAGTEIGLGTYAMDSHNTHRYIDANGDVEAEGNFWLNSQTRTYSVAYGSITPKQAEATNLLVSSAFSASHTAYGSMRMEPVFMVLGQSAGTAAVRAIEEGTTVQQIDLATYQSIMRAYGQVLTTNEPNAGPFVGMLREDFHYGETSKDLETVSYIAPGWAEPWQADGADPKFVANENLSYDAEGYVNSHAYGFSGAAGDGSGQRAGHITIRNIRGGMSGEAWMTALVQVDPTTGAESLLWLDGVSADDAMGIADDGSLELLGNQLAGSFDDGQVHLLLARLQVGSGNDSIELWIDPDLKDLGQAQMTSDGADLFGDSLDLLGLSVGDNGGLIDAIRLSNSATAFGDVLGLLAGDADMDMDVDLADASILLSNWASGTGWSQGDFDGDGDVDADDAIRMLDNWGAGMGDDAVQAPAALLAVVPEPGMMTLLGLGALAGLRRRRKR